VRADEFKKDGPSDDVSGHFAESRRGVVGAKSEPVLAQQDRREGARNEKEVIEPIMEKRNVAMRFDPPAVGRVKRATEQKKRVEDESEPLHKSARMIMPKPNPSNNFSRITLLKITNR
jgi:hypothetical protein